MNFDNIFKLLYMQVQDCGGKIYECFEPKLNLCAQAYKSGDIETAVAMLNFISGSLLNVLEKKKDF